MAQTVGAVTTSLIRVVANDTDPANIALAETEHSSQVDAEIVAVGLGGPSQISTAIGRTSNGRHEIFTVLIWI
jgi:hypothetical protein